MLEKTGFLALYPPQEKAIESGILEGKNFVLSMPTASGKTLLAELCLIQSIIKRGGRCLYVAPLRALASEKYEDFNRKYAPLGIKVGIATGDYDIPSPHLTRYQILIATSEKIDSLLRFRAPWLSQDLSIAIFDEIHFLNDPGRGPTLEILIARLRQLNPRMQVLALSATIANAWELAKWLEAECVMSRWRPVPLKEGVYFHKKIRFADGEDRLIKEDALEELPSLVLDTIKEEAQVLVFVNTRRSTQATAAKIAQAVYPLLNQEEKKSLTALAKKIEGSRTEATKICRKLSEAVQKGAAFHHAGLRPEQRKLIEDAFRKNLIKVISATPTLAAGVNLPARRAVIRDYRRYKAGLGSCRIAVFEYKQMCGRAGRPQYDDYGEAVLVARSNQESEALFEEFILAEPEPITSKLENESALRTHLLSSIASGYVRDEKGMMEFLRHTFFACQKETEDLYYIIDKIMEFLHKEKMIEKFESGFRATPFGEEISRLYIDPLSGVVLRDGIITARQRKTSPVRVNSGVNISSLLHLISLTPDMDTLRLNRKDYEPVELYAKLHENDFLLPADQFDYENHLTICKTAYLLESWANEEKEDTLCDKFGLGPGDIHRLMGTADWLIYSGRKLAKLFATPPIANQLENIRRRVKYGIKEELLDLVKLKGIGRVRARALYQQGFRNLSILKKTEISKLTKIPYIGKETAESIKRQLSPLSPRR
ncbi:MAG: DEAD/DEAH box helicase [Candidatus Ratteibacteria bacterium]|nr:DEAD/DEAH box helicase [Candidatus Ratteibacteria bacterium]